jgi:AcrR family transcriptional regulator
LLAQIKQNEYSFRAMATVQKPTNKREAVMAAALELFVERGFFGTAVPEIAAKAGVGAGTIYRYFASKEVLVNEIYRAEKMRWGEVLVGSVPTTTARELFRSLWMRMARFVVENERSFGFMELHHHARYLDAESRALEQRMLDLFANVVTAAQARGELKPAPPRLLMAFVMGAFVGVVRTSIEQARMLSETEWKLAEQCGWEAIRA